MLKWIGIVVIGFVCLPSFIKAQEPEVEQEPPTAKELGAALEAAGKLAQEKKYEEARAAYQAVMKSAPGTVSAAQAQHATARSYLAESNLTAGIKQLQLLLKDPENLPPELQEKAQAELAQAQFTLASQLTQQGKPQSAIAILKEVAENKQAAPVIARRALLEIAHNHEASKRPDLAIATYQQLLERPSVGDAERLADIIALTSLQPAAYEKLQAFIADHPAADSSLLAQARYAMGAAYHQLGEKEKALSVYDELATSRKTPLRWLRAALIGKADLALEAGEKAQAVELYRNILRRPIGDWANASVERLEDLNRLVEISPGADVTEEFANFLSQIEHTGAINATRAIPDNDVLLVGIQPNVDYLVGHQKSHLRQTKGRATEKELQAIRERITKGGSSKPFSSTQFSKQVASKLSKDAPLGEYLKPLLMGDHQTAAQIAWNQARLATDVHKRAHWLQALAVAVRCHDQRVAGRDVAFLKWLASADESPNPLAELVGEQPLEFEPSEAEFAEATSHLNGAAAPSDINAEDQVLRALPKKDVLIIGWKNQAAAADAQQKHIWRTVGKDNPALMSAVNSQLTKGGQERYFSVSPASKKLAGAILDDAPLASYLKPLLSGEHLIAAKVAWKNARVAQDHVAYQGWIEAAAAALRCHDQSYVRGAELLAWSRGEGLASVDQEEGDNLVVGVFSLEPIPFSTDKNVHQEAMKNFLEQVSNGRVDVRYLVPGNDVVLAITNMSLMGHNDNRWLFYYRSLWRTQGRALPSQIETMKKQLTQGGEDRPFIVSAEAKKLAASLPKDLPSQTYLQALLAGKHQEAAQIAWEKARLSDDDAGYFAWAAKVALAANCHDQTVSGRGKDFISWVHGSLKDAKGQPVMVNPLADLLEQ